MVSSRYHHIAKAPRSIAPRSMHDHYGSVTLQLPSSYYSRAVVVAFFHLACEDFRRMFNYSFPAYDFFLSFKVKLSSRTLIPLFRPGSIHSGSGSREDCGRVFSEELRVSSFPDRFPHYSRTAAYSAHSDFVGSRVYACFRCNLPPALLTE